MEKVSDADAIECDADAMQMRCAVLRGSSYVICRVEMYKASPAPGDRQSSCTI